MKKKLIVLSGFVLGFAPMVALAQITTGIGAVTVCTPGAAVTDIPGMLCKIGQILNAIVPVLIALGVVYFVWGVITYVIASDEEAKKTGRNRIIYGIIGLAVIVAVWGLVNIVVRTFVPQGNQSTITLPTIGQ
ncbi:MAG: hypothetical protein KGL67_02825 [Patescibacteria group bacterium]|nr:hypothetical protein [Patescibacteria group bacterium]